MMKIRVVCREGERKRKLFVPMPNCLLSIWLRSKWMKQFGISLTSQQSRKLLQEVRRCKKRHPDWVLVEVDDASGEQVRIMP